MFIVTEYPALRQFLLFFYPVGLQAHKRFILASTASLDVAGNKILWSLTTNKNII